MITFKYLGRGRIYPVTLDIAGGYPMSSEAFRKRLEEERLTEEKKLPLRIRIWEEMQIGEEMLLPGVYEVKR